MPTCLSHLPFSMVSEGVRLVFGSQHIFAHHRAMIQAEIKLVRKLSKCWVRMRPPCSVPAMAQVASMLLLHCFNQHVLVWPLRAWPARNGVAGSRS